MGKNALVIGAGYLGGWIAKHLREEGVSVTCTRTTGTEECLQFDLFSDDPARLVESIDPSLICFAAEVERASEKENLYESFGKLIHAVGSRRFVYLSSDGVFGGETGQYKEEDEPYPKTPTGKNLKMCEEMVCTLPHHLIVRCSYLYGKDVEGREDGRSQEIYRAAEERHPIERWTDVFKSPERVDTVARGVVEIGLSTLEGIIHIAGARVSIFDFARLRLLEAGLSDSWIVPVECRDPSIPRDTSLDCYRLRSLIYKRHSLKRAII